MDTKTQPDSAVALLREVDLRMAQALENFFQRSRSMIHDAIMRCITRQMTPSMLATGQTCLTWVDVYPDKLSTAFANQFRQHQVGAPSPPVSQAATLQLVNDDLLARQLAEDKAANHLTEALQPEMLLLFSRLLAVQKNASGNVDYSEAYGPLPVMHALSRALEKLEIDTRSGTLLLQCATIPLRDTLKHTYTALTQYLADQGVEEHTTVRAIPTPPQKRDKPPVGKDILTHIQTLAAHPPVSPSHSGGPTPMFSPPPTNPATGRTPFPSLMPGFVDSLVHWQADLPRVTGPSNAIPTLVLRQFQQHAGQTDAGTFDLAMLDAVAGLFEFILDDPDVSPHYKSEIAQLQIPVLRVALSSPEFFSEDQHPARQLIDLLGSYSRYFPEHSPQHLDALTQIEAACNRILDESEHPLEAINLAHGQLASWLKEAKAQSSAGLSSDVSNLERIEKQELGTLLALENLNDLTARYPAPESVLRRMEAAWVPYMASLYVAESGEGPEWRAACMTQLQLFLSLQPPDDGDMREARLQSIPQTNAELRRGLLAQGAEPAQLKDFFAAITATQECWIRPSMGQHEDRVSTFEPRHITREEIEAFTHRQAGNPADDDIQLQTEQLLEGDWVDFDPPYEGLSTARVAWVGVHGYMLFCDSEGEQRFSLDCDRLATEIRAGRAAIPEQSLTRKAMLRLKTQLINAPV